MPHIYQKTNKQTNKPLHPGTSGGAVLLFNFGDQMVTMMKEELMPPKGHLCLQLHGSPDTFQTSTEYIAWMCDPNLRIVKNEFMVIHVCS